MMFLREHNNIVLTSSTSTIPTYSKIQNQVCVTIVLVVPVLNMSWKCPVLVPVSLFLGQNPYLCGHQFRPINC